MKKYLVVAFSIILFSFIDVAHAAENFWDTLSKRPDVEITTHKSSTGKILRTAKLSSGVVFSETEHGSIIDSDNSGLGAVKCVWMMTSETKNLLNACYKDSHQNYKNAYNKAIDRMHDFIVTNSISPISKSEIETIEKTLFEESHKNIPLNKLCGSDFLPKTKDDMSEDQLRIFEESIDKLLSVPRPPVANPCL